MKINRQNLELINKRGKITMPLSREFELPEKVLQFGTGVLLRGLPDYFISKANKQDLFNGLIVVVKSTDKGNTKAFDAQDNLYTLVIRGLEGENLIREEVVCSAISRVLSAQSDWEDILKLAASTELEIVISNTTEKGITYIPESVGRSCPESFPGKLLAVLFHRYQAFDASESAGLIILPTELVTENGHLLRQILNQLAVFNNLDSDFIGWMNEHNVFCNTLVDRIVPGSPEKDIHQQIEVELGYEDDLMIMSESYALWAIEGPAMLKKKLSFGSADSGIIIADDIAVYKELKLRILNGTHTLTCAIAILSGFKTVKEAMENQSFRKFLSSLIEEELSFGIPIAIDREQTLQFGQSVADRFSNPYINHLWSGISTNYTLKLSSRVIPAIVEYHKKFNTCPQRMAFGFAAYLILMSSVRTEADGYDFTVEDSEMEYLTKISGLGNTSDYVQEVLSNEKLWNTDLSKLKGLAESVIFNIDLIKKKGVEAAMAIVIEKAEKSAHIY